MTDEQTNVVTFRKDVPTSSIKRMEFGDPRASCMHRRVCVAAREPVLECADCGGLVDPYEWIRILTREWAEVERRLEEKKRSAEREIAVLQKRLSVLRGEYDTEAERISVEREAVRAIAVLPPQRGRRG